MDLDDTLSYLIDTGHRWLQEQRDLHMAKARLLTDSEKRSLEAYYDKAILDKVRIATVDGFSNPAFYEEISATGHPVLDISNALGMTFIDCIAIRSGFKQDSSSWLSILFHELVHALQCDILGSRKLVELYLRGWAENGFQYGAVPLEDQAHRLESRFNSDKQPFPVREIVAEELSAITGTP